ncbi:MAG TPA: hypothetical protein VMR34_01475 [Candidatus Saccharimonadales bacterium]|nr:hypothetical protein [Candidatus Saccharimonadales bacterium]
MSLSPEIDVEVQLRLGFPDASHREAISELLAHAEKLGGLVIGVTTDLTHTHEGSGDMAPFLIGMSEFTDYARGVVSSSWAARSWDAGVYASNEIGRAKADSVDTPFVNRDGYTVDPNNILDYMRGVERGDLRTSSFAKTAWNLFGAIINHRFRQDGETVVLGWIEEIHKKFRLNAADSTNKEGVSALKDLYQACL